jgi:DNA-binding CsgD family transcriptional regulator
VLDVPAGSDYEQRLEQAEIEIDNLRAAFGWSRESGDVALALQLASSLQPLWIQRGRVQEGLTWFNTALADKDREVPSRVRARALIDRAMLDASIAVEDNSEQAEQALAIARQLDDRALLIQALSACAGTTMSKPEVAGPFLAEAIDLARASGSRGTLGQLLALKAFAALMDGDPITARLAAEEGRDLADAVGNRFGARVCRIWLSYAQVMQGDLVVATAKLVELVTEADADCDVFARANSLVCQIIALAHQGEGGLARVAAPAALEASNTLGGLYEEAAYVALAMVALAEGDVVTALEASEGFLKHSSARYKAVTTEQMAQVLLACGDVNAARRWANDAVAAANGFHLMLALTTRAHVAIAQGEPEQADRDAHDALACAADVHAYLRISDTLECLATLAVGAANPREAARLFGAAHGIRQRMGAVRFKVWDAGYGASVTALRDTMGEKDFDAAWAEGAALSVEEAIAYAQRGRGERKRPTSGWDSLTPTERDVVRLVSEGLANNDIATRLFVSPRTVQTHLTHVYTKLGLTSRVQLVQEAARHG